MSAQRMSSQRMNERDDERRILSERDCAALVERLRSYAQGGGELLPQLTSWWQGELRWGRNRVTLGSDRREVRVQVLRKIKGLQGQATTNQLDPQSLEAVVRAAEHAATDGSSPGSIYPELSFEPPVPKLDWPLTAVWSDATFNLTTEARGAVARALAEPAEAQGLLSAGYLEVRAGSLWQVVNDVPRYNRFTQAQCSMTVRDSQGTGSGWAGLSSYDWTKIDAPVLAKRAMDKCLASRNPVALEPGRYTVILEPQAVADLLEVLVASFGRGNPAEIGNGPFALSLNSALNLWRTKLGLKVIDERLTIRHDPADSELGILPTSLAPDMQPVTWVDHGKLTALDYDRGYAIRWLGENRGAVRPPNLAYRMSGGTTSLEDMIATTTRGLLVTRFWNVRAVDTNSLLSTGLTRDGLWLIENGKITKPVKNFRFTESPLFMLNQLEQLGVPVSVFRPITNPDIPGLTPAIVPPLKARDFSFTSMADAV